MKKDENTQLYKRTKKLRLQINHVAEVGVWRPISSNVLGFIYEGCKTELVEPDPITIKDIHSFFSDYPNVTLHPYAVFSHGGQLALYRKGASTFAAELNSSPALVNDKYQPDDKDIFYAEAKLFNQIDDGTLDLVSIDIEGAEWYVLEYMISRPKVISVETHGRHYKNPFSNEIALWMKANNYKVWYKDKSDTIYLKSEIKTDFFSRLFK